MSFSPMSAAAKVLFYPFSVRNIKRWHREVLLTGKDAHSFIHCKPVGASMVKPDFNGEPYHVRRVTEATLPRHSNRIKEATALCGISMNDGTDHHFPISSQIRETVKYHEGKIPKPVWTICEDCAVIAHEVIYAHQVEVNAEQARVMAEMRSLFNDYAPVSR